MDNFDDLFCDTNGPAYQKEQKRFGPPLEYVGEKLRNSVESWHEVLQNVSENIADDLSSGRLSVKKDLLLSPAHYGFYNALIAFLALHNMLGSAQSPSLVSEHASKSKDEFKLWLDFIEREGSITESRLLD